MNLKFQRINIEEVVFFDIETVRGNKELEIDSREYKLYRNKTRNRDTDEFLTDEELKKDYERRGGLFRGFNKIVTIGIGMVRGGVPYIKSITGTEEEIIREFVTIVNQFKYCCSFNGNSFDLPIIVGNGMKYFNIAEELKDSFNPSGKKMWNLDFCIDLLDVYRGTHYISNSLDDLCYHFGIPTPKDGINGADVSRVYYEGGIEQIVEYCKKDILANINIFLKMQNKEIFTDFVDRNDVDVEDIVDILEEVELDILLDIHTNNSVSRVVYDELKKRLKENKPLKYDWENLEKMLYAAMVNNDFINMNQDNKATKESKQEEAKTIIKNLKAELDVK